MSLLVTGSIAIDTVRTPEGVSENCLGGSSVYFAMAASFFCPVRLVGVVGEDFNFDLAEVFAGRDIDLAGLETRAGSRTFRWTGTYYGAMNERTTDRLELNVLAEAPPKVPDAYRDSEFVFLANTAPALQLELLEQIDRPRFVAADTMNCWIENESADLTKLLAKINCLIINDDEARLLGGRNNLVEAAKTVLKMGPGIVIVKKGEHGSLVCDGKENLFLLPAYPAERVKDPTGAGDSFAGAVMGRLAQTGQTDFQSLKTALTYGTVIASFTIEDFSLKALKSTTADDIEKRLVRLKTLTGF